MGKEENKGARAAETDSSLCKATRLEPTDSVRSNTEEDVTSDASKECEHFYFDTEEMYMFSEAMKRLKADPQCIGCNKADPQCIDCNATARKLMLQETNSRFVMCSGCSQCFCAGLVTNEEGPMGHARHHAMSTPEDIACSKHTISNLSLEVIASAARAHEPYVVRGIPTRGHTCFVNALVQCLLALGELRLCMFGPDAPTGSLGRALKDLFVETVAGDDPKAMLNPDKLLHSLGTLNTKYQDRTQQDSHELLLDLHGGLNEELLKRSPDMRKDVPTVVDSIFQGQLSDTFTCKSCSEPMAKPVSFYELPLTLPPNGYPTKSDAPQRSGRKKRKDITDLFQQIWKEDEHKSADQRKVDSLPSIKECLEYYFRKEVVIRRCESCTKDEEPSTSQTKDGGQMVAGIKEHTSVDWGQTEHDRHGKAEEKRDLFSAHDKQNASTVNQETRMQANLPFKKRMQTKLPFKKRMQTKLENTAHSKGRHADKVLVLSKLPPVLTLHVLRFEGKGNAKRPGHVKFEENLDVGKYLDPRSKDKDNARYRLVGVIQHMGNALKEGHCVAYVRGSRTGSEEQQSSGSSKWFCADDSTVREVSLANVLKCEAYLLFYERIED
ncbi:unnamed protein product [Urochloa decumbens]|uniref:USP domain-containing protein n=1 Tax=Urochloa decumbens TaxID=240449 RepID=A0ABC9BWE4_9POAL